jgi:histidinol-phosphate/aromatic aminotransferase/cobyric acid decarboxylase-like protein
MEAVDTNTKMILCSPNNPTGNSLDECSLSLQNFKGLVVIDEAY